MRAAALAPVLVVAGALCGCGGGSGDAPPATTSPTTGFPLSRIGETVRIGTGAPGVALRMKLAAFDRSPRLTADEQPPAGNRRVVARLEVRNVGDRPFDESIFFATELVASDESRDGASSDGFRGCTPSQETRIPVGGTEQVCLPFTIDSSTVPASVQMAFGSRLQDQSAEWVVGDDSGR